MRQEIEKLPNWWKSDEFRQAMKTHIKNYYLLFDQNGFLGELDWNVGTTTYHIIGSDNGYLWVQRRYEDERDYRTFVKYKISVAN